MGRRKGGSVAISQVKLWQAGADGKRKPVALGGAAADFVQKGHRVDRLTKEKPDDVGWAVFHPGEGYSARRVAVFELKEPLEVEAIAASGQSRRSR